MKKYRRWDIWVMYILTTLTGLLCFVVLPLSNVIVVSLTVADGPHLKSLVLEGHYNDNDTQFLRPVPASLGPVFKQAGRIARTEKLLERSDSEAALKTLNAAQEPGPDRLFLARLLNKEKRFKESLEVYLSLVRVMPFDPYIKNEWKKLGGKSADIELKNAKLANAKQIERDKRVWINPEYPANGDTITIRYKTGRAYALSQNSEKVFLHWGINNWMMPPVSLFPPGISTEKWYDGKAVNSLMKKIDDNTWELALPTGVGMKEVNFVFTDGKKWDNNLEWDWSVELNNEW